MVRERTSLLLIVLCLLSAGCRGQGAASPGEPATRPTEVISAPESCEGLIIEQSFERGRMFWVGASPEEKCQVEHSYAPGSGEIWVVILAPNGIAGAWYYFPDEWQPTIDAESDPGLAPPEGLLQPVRGFGKVWRDFLDDNQRAALGWATAPEIAILSEYVYEPSGFTNHSGTLVARPGQHRLVGADGTVYLLNDISGRVTVVPGE